MRNKAYMGGKSPADVLEEGPRRLEETIQEDISLAALRRAERIDVSDEMIHYQTTLFAKSGTIWQLRKCRIPTHPKRNVNDGWIDNEGGVFRITFRLKGQNAVDKSS
jgi:hypothetical protein